MKPAPWFLEHGVQVFPVKPRDKEPACKSWDDYRCSKQEAARLVNYGVVLGMLAVADSDSPETEAWAQRFLPPTPLQVTTGRGRHRYYRLNGPAPHFFHRSGLTIEFRHAGQYVVGPGSVHKSGSVYRADAWSWRMEDVPFFPAASFLWDDRPPSERGSTGGGAPLTLPPVVKAGERHDLLFKLMRSLQARGVEDVETLLRVLKVENKAKCRPPIDESELERYIRRVAKYRDRPGFERDAQSPGLLINGLVEDVGLTLEAAVAASGAALDVPAGLRKGFEPEGPARPFSQPKQPSQPRLGKNEDSTDQKEAPRSVDSTDRLVCFKCEHSWLPKRKTLPKTCPNCRSTTWNRGVISLDENDDEGDVIDLDAGQEDSDEIIDEDWGRENDEVIDLDEGDDLLEAIDEDVE